MTDTRTILRQLFTEGRPLVEQAIEAAEQFKAMSETARVHGIDWSQVKALMKAQVLDEADGGKRVEKIINKADNATAYADMLGLASNMNGKNISRSEVTGGGDEIPPSLKRGDPSCFVKDDSRATGPPIAPLA